MPSGFVDWNIIDSLLREVVADENHPWPAIVERLKGANNNDLFSIGKKPPTEIVRLILIAASPPDKLERLPAKERDKTKQKINRLSSELLRLLDGTLLANSELMLALLKSSASGELFPTLEVDGLPVVGKINVLDRPSSGDTEQRRFFTSFAQTLALHRIQPGIRYLSDVTELVTGRELNQRNARKWLSELEFDVIDDYDLLLP